MQIKQPKGVKTKMRGRKLVTGVKAKRRRRRRIKQDLGVHGICGLVSASHRFQSVP
jgi:hypothetical protein